MFDWSSALAACCDPFLCRWICVALQYLTKLDMPLLEHSLRHAGESVLPKRCVKFQVAAETDCAHLMGFIKNAVTPYGSCAPSIPVRS